MSAAAAVAEARLQWLDDRRDAEGEAVAGSSGVNNSEEQEGCRHVTMQLCSKKRRS